MHCSAKRGVAIACRLSVCDVGGSGSHRLEMLETNCTDISPTPSLFVAQRPSTYFQGNMGKFSGRLEVGWEKVACPKAAISLKLVNIEETLLWMAYRNLATFVRTVPSPTPYGLLFPRMGVLNPNPKL